MLATLFASATVAGCSSEGSNAPDAPEHHSRVGQIGAELDLGGIIVNSVSWTLRNTSMSAPAGWTGDRTGTFDVTGAGRTFTELITGVPAGSGYDLTLTATSTGMTHVCQGHAMPTPFSVVANQTVLQTVHMNCQDQRVQTGKILVNGELNVCPTADDLTALPLSAPVGSSIMLSGYAVDPDAAPSALLYSFALSAMQPAGHGMGTLQSVDTTTGSASLRCDSAGPVSISMTITDGDSSCTGGLSIEALVICTGTDAGFCSPNPCPQPSGMCQIGGMCDAVTQSCTPVANAPDATACDDMNATTALDRCVGGACVGNVYNCNPGEACCACESVAHGTDDDQANCINASYAGDHLVGTTTAMAGSTDVPAVVGGVAYSAVFRQLLSCMHETGCAGADGLSGSDCFCGIGVIPGICHAGSVAAASGPCKTEFIQAADSNIMDDIMVHRFANPAFPSGVAIQMSETCDGLFCVSECLGNSIPVGGGANVCPTADDLTAEPLSVSVGSSSMLTGYANDPDLAPSPLSYSFVVSPMPGAGAGTLQNVNSASGTASLRCDAPGPVSITMTVTDGDSDCTGDVNLSMQTFVICSP